LQSDEYKLPKKDPPLLASDFFKLKCTVLFIHLKKELDIPFAQHTVDMKQLLPAPPLAAHFDIQYDPYQAHFPSVNASTSSLHSLFDSIDFGSNVSFLDAKAYRTARSQHTSAPTYLTKVSDIRWRWIWSLTMICCLLNVVYCLILDEIPNRQLLDFIREQHIPSLKRLLCPNCNEGSNRLLFFCPNKANMWKEVIFEFLWFSITIPEIINSTNTLDFYNGRYCQKPNMSAHFIIFITLAQVWKAHFRFFFDEEPLNISHILITIREDAKRYQEETQVHPQQ
jgi:hypothetical protein